MKSTLLYVLPIALFLHGVGIAQNNVGIGVLSPQEKLDVAGAVRIGNATGDHMGTVRFLNGRFQGNTDGTSDGWRMLDGPWLTDINDNYYLSHTGLKAAIGDSLVSSIGKLYVKEDVSLGGAGIRSVAWENGNVIADGWIGYRHAELGTIYSNFGVLGRVFDDGLFRTESFGLAGLNEEGDEHNYGGYFIAQGFGERNYGVYATAQLGLVANYAGYFNGNTVVTDKLSIGTDTAHAEAKVHIELPLSGNFEHVRIESPGTTEGFGIAFRNSLHENWIGQNIGNWNDGRFSIASGSSFNCFVMMQNGDVGLTNTTLLTPFARLQVPQKGSLNNGGLDVDNAAIFIGETTTQGMAFDENQIEVVGGDMNLNFNSNTDIIAVQGGGNFSVGAGSPKAKFHVAEDKTVLFGKDTVGDVANHANKLMWLPARHGALRAGRLFTDLYYPTGSLYWDPDSIGYGSVAMGYNTRATWSGAVAMGFDAKASNAASVAMGLSTLASGYASVALGNITKAESWLSMAVGSCNTGGGNAQVWVDTDPIFEVGNSEDPEDRHNALTVLKSARVGINHSSPQAMLDIEQLGSGPGNGVLMNLAGSGHWETVVDNAQDYNFYYNNTLKAYIRDTDGAYVQSSDLRLKTEVKQLPDVLPGLERLGLYSYYFNDAQSTNRSLGVIAQEVEQLFPDLVSEKDGYLGVNYQGLSVIALKAVQELSEKNEKLSAEVETLRSEIAEIRTLVNSR